MSGQIIEHNGKFYREVDRKAEIGDLVRITKSHDKYFNDGDITKITDIDEYGYRYANGNFDDEWCLDDEDDGAEYVVLEPIEPETGPQTQHEAIANLALKVAKLIEKVDAQEAAIDEILSRLGRVEADLGEHSAPMAELQLAILRADLPLDFRLDLIREAERLRNERLALIESTRGLDE